MLVAVIVFDGFDEGDALGPLEGFHSATISGADLHARLVTRTEQPVRRARSSAQGMALDRSSSVSR